MSEARLFEQMVEGDDGWSDWVHPLPGYLMKCCDCGLVHEMEFQITTNQARAAGVNPGEDDGQVIILRARRLKTTSDTPPSPR